MLCHMFALL